MSSLIQERFRNEISSHEIEKLIPRFHELESVPNHSLVKVSNASVIQDCIEDEFYQSVIKTESGFINSGLWTRSLYDPSGKLNDLEMAEPDYSNLQVRKRMLAVCKNSGKPFAVALYKESVGKSEDEWEKWRQDTFKMNSLHEFIGIYEVADCEEDSDTLHLIKLNEHVIEGLCPISEDESLIIRSRLVEYLASCMNDNKSAAETLMLWLVSRPSMRVDGLVDSLFIGKLSLNLCVKSSDNSADELDKILRGIKPFVAGPVRVDVNPEAGFTKESIYPRLDVQSGQLGHGATLQQPDGCVLIVDEMKLSEGEFKDQAVCNLQALIDLIRQQHVNYDFGMQQVPLKTDMPVISVSCMKKSVLPFDLRVDCDFVKYQETGDAKLFMSYLHHCRMMNCSVSEEMANFLENDYLSLRKSSPLLPNGNPKMNEQEFHRLMNLARLAAVSHGQSSLSKEIWEETKSLYLN